MRLFKDATARGVIIVSVTQCTSGSVGGIYATGKALLDLGAAGLGELRNQDDITIVVVKKSNSLD